MARKILISLNEAIKLVQKEKKDFIKKEKIKLEHSLGRISSKNITSPVSLPSYDSAGLDGYVLSSNKSKKIIKISKKVITPGKLHTNLNTKLAYKINTGSIIPDKFSFFISLENASIKKDCIDILNSKISNKDIKKKSEDLKKGKIILKKNQKINFRNISLLASAGIKFLDVYKLLKIGVVSNGNELVPLNKIKNDFQIFDSNKLQILNFLKQYNVDVYDLGILRDDISKVESFYKNKINSFDIIVSSGGSSFSSGDLISSFLEKKSRIIFKYIRMQPGRPIIFSKYQSKYIFSLPGNPLAVFINLMFVIKPFLENHKKIIEENIKFVKSGFSDVKKMNLTKFYRVKIKDEIAFAHNSKGSAKLISISESDGLLISNENEKKIIKGKKYNFVKF
jgi:molybdopterin molybdotransferase